jgi:glutamate-ammonia-ligase adenylyltransferase
VLPRLGNGKGLSAQAVQELSDAYNFLRRLENSIQAIRDQQTHDLPDDLLDRARLLVAMNTANWDALGDELKRHQHAVSQRFAEIAFRSDDETTQSDLTNSLAGLWSTTAAADAWTILLEANNYDRASPLASTIVGFAQSLTNSQIDATAQKRLQQFVVALVMLIQDRKQPDIVCQRVFNVAARVVRRSAYIALLNENPAAMRHLVNLCEQSAYLADEIARFPLLLDEMIDPRQYAVEISASSMREDLAQRLQRAKEADSEQQIEILAQFQRATLFRIAIKDFGEILPIMKVSDCLTDLAEIVLRQALHVAWHDLIEKHGAPYFHGEHGVEAAGLGIIAYGKMGGMELSYRSDLDLVFLHDSRGSEQETVGEKPLDNSMFFARLVRRLVHFLTTQTGSGALYEVDTRLRPSGRSGLLVVNLEGFERYQDENAWTWEHQALLRSRPVAGSDKIAREFERIRSETLRTRVNREQLAEDVVSMRSRMREQLDKSTDQLFDLKQGEGGIGDIEFLVQFLVLKNADNNPAVIHYPDNIRQLGALGAAAFLPTKDVERLQDICRAYRLRLHRASLNGESSLVAADEFVGERDFVTSMWRTHLK